MGVKELAKRVLVEKENRRYARLLAERKGSYPEWLAQKERVWQAQGADAGQEDYVLICLGEGQIAPYAHRSIAGCFARYPEAQILYGDEDVRTPDGEEAFPWFKADWSPDLLESSLYFGSLVAVRLSHWEEMREKWEREAPGQWELLFGAAEDGKIYRPTDRAAYEKWLHEAVEKAYRKGSRLVEHIPQILFHAKSREQQEVFLMTSDFLREARQRMLAGFCELAAADGAAGKTLLSVIIPSKDQPALLEKCIEKVQLAGRDIPCEILVIDNGSSPQNRAQIKRTIEGISAQGLPGRYLYEPMEFNFSYMCNLGAKHAKGKLLLFLNDDVELAEDCIRMMAPRALRDHTGAVGIKLLYPDTALIQHDGVVSLPVGPVHKLQFHDDNRCYYYNRNKLDCNCSAVTGACLMVAADKFWEAGGFPEKLRVAYNDVALCFALRELGYYNVVVNDCAAWHHESLSRGDDESPEKQERLVGERRLLYLMHPGFYGTDPYYPEGLTMDGADSRIVPEYPAFRNQAQKSDWKEFSGSLEKFRRDDCLMVRTQIADPEKIQGYSVVLGDNNACYDKYLLLLPEQEGKCPVYMKTQGQYRQELEENLPDQENVALGGFCVRRDEEKLQPGVYRIAMLAVNRVNGLKLWNESGRKLTVEEEQTAACSGM